jgi:hypothetical protein
VDEKPFEKQAFQTTIHSAPAGRARGRPWFCPLEVLGAGTLEPDHVVVENENHRRRIAAGDTADRVPSQHDPKWPMAQRWERSRYESIGFTD